jgi:hypothetical protein
VAARTADLRARGGVGEVTGRDGVMRLKPVRRRGSPARRAA